MPAIRTVIIHNITSPKFRVAVSSKYTRAARWGARIAYPDPDTVHFGFVAKSHAEVNAFFVAAIAAGGREKTAPAAQFQYHPDYYATWALDPDGRDVEVVNKTGQIG
jgi:predicted lactoylglutathione lyase